MINFIYLSSNIDDYTNWLDGLKETGWYDRLAIVMGSYAKIININGNNISKFIVKFGYFLKQIDKNQRLPQSKLHFFDINTKLAYGNTQWLHWLR